MKAFETKNPVSRLFKTFAARPDLVLEIPIPAARAVSQWQISACRTQRERLGFVRDLFRALGDSISAPEIPKGEPPETNMLTRKQSELLRFIHERLQESGVPPSFDEMKDALDLRSKSGIHRLIMALEERGFIRRLANRARAIEVLRLPESATVSTPRAQKFSPSVIPGSLGRLRTPQPSREGETAHPVMVPLMGRIAAGTPISAIQTRTQTLAMPPEFLGSGEHFALEVRGDSMIEAGILENDTVIIRKQETAETGDIVVALIDEEEATLKTIPQTRGVDRARSGQSRV